MEGWVPTAIEPHKFQLCIRDEGLAEEFYDGGVNIEEVFFFQEQLHHCSMIQRDQTQQQSALAKMG